MLSKNGDNLVLHQPDPMLRGPFRQKAFFVWLALMISVAGRLPTRMGISTRRVQGRAR